MPEILITGASVLNAENGTLEESLDVLVVGSTIQDVGRGLRANPDAIRINAGGRTLNASLLRCSGVASPRSATRAAPRAG